MDINTELAFLDQIQALIRSRSSELDRRMTNRRNIDRELAEQIYSEGLIERDEAVAELANLNNEMAQNQQQYRSEHQERTALKRLLNSPYFAGISFSFSGEEVDSETFRLGLMGLSDPEDLSPLIIDWRSPIASLFYEYNRGQASYQSPTGYIEGLLTEKKQVVIRDGELLRLFDTDEEVQDEILQSILSESSSQYMHNIVATLQRDQNRLIRVNPKASLLIQGAAGSGKTSIAMHRAAFLLYKDPKLKAVNILLLTPNEQLADYVSEVLPDLGEENARQQLWIDPLVEEIATKEARFSNVRVQTSSLEKRVAAGSFSLIDALEAFIKEDEKQIFRPWTIDVGDYQIPEDVIWNLYSDNYANYPPMHRARLMIDNLRDYVIKSSNDRGRNFGQARGEIESELASMYEANTILEFTLRFTDWLKTKDEWASLYQGPAIREDDLQFFDEVDITIFAFLKIFYYGSELDWQIKHLILDEMQDVFPLAHRVLQLIFPCPKTVLGDVNQAIHFPLEEDYLDQLTSLYKQVDSKLEVANLLQAYRSTYEINEFSKELLGLTDVISFDRHGDKVDIIVPETLDPKGVVSLGDVYRSLKEQIHQLSIDHWKNCAVICRDEASVILLEDQMPEQNSFGPNWRLLTLSEAKGLEFDAVIVVNLDGVDDLGEDEWADDIKIKEHSRKVRWYVAATRALHKLVIILQNDVPSFLPQE